MIQNVQTPPVGTPFLWCREPPTLEYLHSLSEKTSSDVSWRCWTAVFAGKLNMDIDIDSMWERRLSFSLSFWSVPSFVIFVHKVHEPEPPFMQLYSCYMCRGYSATRTTGLCSWNMGIILNHHGNNTEHFSGNHQEQKNDITNKHGKATKLVVAGSTSKEPCGCTDINAENPPFVDFSERETIGFPHFLHVYPT